MVNPRHPDTPRNRGDDDAPHLSPATPADDARTILLNRVSWGAVLAGVVVALVTQLILNLLGVGLGAATLDPAAGAADNPSATTFSMGAALWWAISGIIAAAAGGYTAGRLAGRPKESTAGWHGLTAWAFTTLLVFYLMTSALGGIIGGAYRTVANAAGNVASAAGEATQTAVSRAADPFAPIEQSIRTSTGGNDPAALRDTAVTALRAALSGDQARAQEARDRAAQALAQAQNIPVDQARTQIQQYEEQYRQAAETVRQRATEAADVAATAVSSGALLSAISLILGAIAAWFAGRMGAVDPTLTARFGLGARSRHGMG
jgi:vacuolar-type H+-ATPase subunit H